MTLKEKFKQNLYLKNSPYSCFMVYSCIPYESDICIKRWNPYKVYSTQRGALSAVKRLKEKHIHLLWKVVWLPYPCASAKESITIYSDEQEA